MKKHISITNFFLMLFFTSILTACGGNNEESNPQKTISGTDSKTWVAKKEYTADGDKDKLTGQEKDQRMTFYQNGKFSIQADADQQNGTWSYDASAKTLALHFTGENVKEVFNVEELDDNKMTIRAADGSKMVMKTE